jgi:hypothetical protein
MPFGLLIGFMNNPQVVTTINYNTVTHLQSLHANLFTLSGAVFTYSVSLNHTLQIKSSVHTISLHIFTLRKLPEDCLGQNQSQSHIATDDQSVSQSVSLGVEPPSGSHDQIFIAV